jgi:hypothetical protein
MIIPLSIKIDEYGRRGKLGSEKPGTIPIPLPAAMDYNVVQLQLTEF